MDPFSRPAIACLGGLVLDRKLRPRGALVRGTSNPVVATAAPGGVARNVAEALARMGAPVALFSIVGVDPEADRLLAGLRELGIDLKGVEHSPSFPTGTYSAVLDEHGELLFGLADMSIFDRLDREWCDRVGPLAAPADLWVVEANLPARVLERLLRSHRRPGTVVAADPVSVAKSVRLRGVLDAIDVIFPDRPELAQLTEMPVEDDDQVVAAAARLREMGVGCVVVSLGSRGVYFDDGKRPRRLPPLPTGRVRDVTGAGDSLLAGYVWALAEEGAPDPVRCALGAASLAVESMLTVPVELTRERLLQRALGEARGGPAGA